MGRRSEPKSFFCSSRTFFFAAYEVELCLFQVALARAATESACQVLKMLCTAHQCSPLNAGETMSSFKTLSRASTFAGEGGQDAKAREQHVRFKYIQFIFDCYAIFMYCQFDLLRIGTYL